MSYEIRKLENSAFPCPECGGRTVKLGIAHIKFLGLGIFTYRKRRCQECNAVYNSEPKFDEVN